MVVGSPLQYDYGCIVYFVYHYGNYYYIVSCNKDAFLGKSENVFAGLFDDCV